MDAHLVFDGPAAHPIGCAQAAVGIDLDLRHGKQRNALDPSRCAVDARQHQVHDVVRQVVLTGRNEDLAAIDAVAAVGLGPCAGAQQAEVRATVGLGQAHGAAPAAGNHRRQETLAQGLVGMLAEGADGAAGKVAVHAPSMVGAADHFVVDETQRGRQALAAVGRVLVQAQPAVGGETLEGLGEARWGADLAILPLATVLVADGVERRQFLLGELGAFLDDGGERGRVRGFAARQLLIVAAQVEQLLGNEGDIAQRGGVAGHAGLLAGGTRHVVAGRHRAPRPPPRWNGGWNRRGVRVEVSSAVAVRALRTRRCRGRPRRVCGTGC
ncbi:hypothetical protein D3C81_804470 [compost metagenome]